MPDTMRATAEDLQRIAGFDHPFTVTAAGQLADAPAGIYAPEYYSDTDAEELAGAGWEALTGYTGQYGYNGPHMHASEYLGGGLARDILATPGVYVVVVVNVLPDNVCVHCERELVQDSDGRWIDPEATGDDSVWRETCDRHDTFTAEHERDEDPEPAGWAVLRLRHVNYPHEEGYLFDCPACEAVCHCTPGTSECVWSGHES
jgi:hypothetical protein